MVFAFFIVNDACLWNFKSLSTITPRSFSKYDKICEKHTLAKKTFELYKNPNYKLKLRYETAKRRFEVAIEIKKTLFLKSNENQLKEM